MKKLTLLFFLMTTISCMEQEKYYSMADYDSVEKIDVHIHVGTNRDTFVEQARKDNFKLLNIVVDFTGGMDKVKESYAYKVDQKRRHSEDYEFATAFSIKEWDDPDWVANTIAWLDQGFDEGAIAVKVWKNIGMVFRDKNGELVMVDDPKLDTIFDFIEERGKTLIGHLGEPKNCWLPLEEMTTNNDQAYFKRNPQYHMYLHPELPSYEEQIAARDRMLEKHPNLNFMGAHMASLEWSVEELAQRLDKFPNMCVDLAARMGQVFYQSKRDREKVREFFIKYQDRLLYATDLADNGKMDPDQMKAEMYEVWIRDWEYFATDHSMTSDLIEGEFKGIKLPADVIDKLYAKNARKWLKMFPEE